MIVALLPSTRLLLACAGGAPVEAPAEPAEIGLAECAVCGMVVREQPAPRGQLLHRDGTRAHVCSIDELRAAITAPSPHGAVRAAWVEALPAGVPVEELGVAPRPWVRVEAAGFVRGVPRERIMGEPLLSYATPEEAAAEAARLGGQAVGWGALAGR